MRAVKSLSSRDPRRSIIRTGVFLAALASLIGGDAVAGQPPASSEIPDYAGATAVPLVTRDLQTRKLRGLTPAEVDQVSREMNPHRTQRDREASRAVNQAIAAMPATVEEAYRSARRSSTGSLIVKTSREEIAPLYGVIGADGKMRFSHDPTHVEDRTR